MTQRDSPDITRKAPSCLIPGFDGAIFRCGPCQRFFLIMRYRPAWEKEAEEIIDRVTRHLAGIPGLVDDNDAQIRLFEQHAGETGFRIINGFPCLIGEDDRHTVPLTLITEYPDETIYGEAFVKGHMAQMETVLSAYDALQALFPQDAIV